MDISSTYPHHIVDLDLMTTQPGMSAEILSTRQSPVKASSMWKSPAQILSRDHKRQTSPPHRPYAQHRLHTSMINYNDTLFIHCPEENNPPSFFYPFCHLIEFGFITTVTSGLLSWYHLIFNNVIDLTTDTVVWELNWAGRWHHFLQNCFFTFLQCVAAKFHISLEVLQKMLQNQLVSFLESNRKLKTKM